MLVAPEVSELDFSNAVTLQGFVIPALDVRRVSTTIELSDGQSFVIAGLLKDNIRETSDKYPILGEIPVLGALFRSSQYQKNETELIIIVTPHLVKPVDLTKQTLPTDLFIDPNDFEFYLLGDLAGGGKVPPAHTTSTSSSLLKSKVGGLEGDFGYIKPTATLRLELEQSKNAELEKIRLKQEQAKHAELEKIRLEQEQATNAELEKIRLEQEQVKHAELEKIKLEQEKAKHEELEKTRLEQEQATNAELEKIRLEQEQATNAELEKIKLEQEQATDAELEKIKLEQEKAKHEELEKIRLEQEQATDAELEKIRLEQEQATNAELEKIREA
jgi:hypothetical protein